MMTAGQPRNGVTQSAFTLSLLWLLLALSSFVLIEPAPYDVLGSGLLVLFFIRGLRIAPGAGAPMFWLFTFVLANIIAAMCAPDPVQSLRSLLIRFYMVLSWLLFTCLIYENPRRVYDIIWSGYIFAAIIAVLFGVLELLKILHIPATIKGPGNVFVVRYENRMAGPFKDPNVFGPYLVPVALYAVDKIIAGSGAKRLVMGALFLWVGLGIFGGFSRGSWVNLGVSFMVVMALQFYTARTSFQYVRLFVLGGIVLGAAALTVSFAISNASIGETFTHRAHLVQYYDDSRFRTQLETLKFAFANPIGIGPGLTAGITGRCFAPDWECSPHNLFIHVLGESGWFGAVAFYVFLAMTLWRGFKFCRQPTAIQNAYITVFACTIGTLTQSLFIDSTHWRHMYLLFAMLWGPVLAWKTDCAAFASLRRSSSMAFPNHRSSPDGDS